MKLNINVESHIASSEIISLINIYFRSNTATYLCKSFYHHHEHQEIYEVQKSIE